MRYLADFAVIVSVRKTERLPTLETELEAVSGAPEKTFEDDAAIDFKWGYDSRAEAEEAVQCLSPILQESAIIGVRVVSYGRDEVAIIFKDAKAQ
jgi:hypothetical protein